MSPESLTAWRLRLGLNKAEAARRLGLARNTLEAYESGANRIPLYIALACSALAFGLPPISDRTEAAQAELKKLYAD